jgi:hypothetical protein
MSSGATVNINIEGIVSEYAAYADELVDAVADEMVREARTQAGTAFTSRSGGLKRSIKKKKSRFDPDTKIVQASAPHAHLIEHGHDIVTHGGVVIGHTAAHPFMATAEAAVTARLPEIVASVTAPTVEVK